MNKVLSIKYRKIFGLFMVVILTIGYLILNTAQPALAQETTRTVTISYPTIAQKLDAGGQAEGITKVTNRSDTTLTFKLGVQDFIVTDTIGTPEFLPPGTLNDKYSAAAWIGATPDTFTLKPGDSQTINYYIQVPQNARPGGHYAALVYSPVVDKTVSGSGSTINSQLGSLFYITINGPIHEQALVSKFFANPFQEYGPVNVLTQLKNLGDLHITPQGTITVTGLFFNQTQNLPTHNIFPEAARDFSNTFGQSLMIGPYKAVLLASYGTNNNLPLMATVSFWVFPWRITLVIVLAIVALILGALYLKKRKKDDSKKPQEAEVEPVATPTEQVK
ncbi:MAG: hypothetical protein ABSE17_03405 [Candidatus Levyibacteriota bacterium]|jgi:preprotein translocase subunit SecG